MHLKRCHTHTIISPKMTSAEQETQSGGGGGEMCQRQWKRKRTEEEEDDDDRYTIAFSSCVRETVVSVT